MITLDLSILNQKGTPMFNSDLTANRPAAGIVGRIFIATDSPYGIFRDTGTAWDQVSGAGSGTTIYTGDGTLTGNRTVSSGGFNLTFAPQTTFLSSLIPSSSSSSYSVLGSNTLTYAAGFSSSNIGNVYSANGAINSQIFSGSATFAQANLASAMVSVNSVDFSSAGSTITMTQSTGIRAMTGHQSQFQYQGTFNGTITHAAVSQNLGFYRPPSATGTLTITNAYGHLINALDDYGAGFTFTNRWGIYQAGASDINYFAGKLLSGSITDTGEKLQITGTAKITSNTFITGGSLSIFTNSTARRINLQVANGSKAAAIGIESAGSLHSVIGIDTSGNDFLQIASVSGVAFYSSSTLGNIVTNPTNERMRFALATGNLLIASTTDTGEKFQLTGTLRINGQASGTAGGSSGQHLIINLDGTTYKIALLNP